MNYTILYNRLIQSRLYAPKRSCYTERHHILPVCLGGTDDEDNLVALTIKEHRMAHLLLAKIHCDNDKLTYAASRICNRINSATKFENYLYPRWLKIKLSRFLSEMNTGRPAYNKGVPMSIEQKKSISDLFLFIHPDGTKEEVLGLNEFCKKYNLNASTMSAVSKGARSHHKGFKCKKLTNTDERHSRSFISKPHPKSGKSPNQIPCKINGIEYKSIGYACLQLNISRSKVEKLNEYN